MKVLAGKELTGLNTSRMKLNPEGKHAAFKILQLKNRRFGSLNGNAVKTRQLTQGKQYAEL